MSKSLFGLAIVVGALSTSTARGADREGLPPADVVFSSRLDGMEQRYVVVLPADLDRTRPTDLMVVLHGHGSDRWQFIRDERDECRAVRDAAARYGMILVSPDYRATTSWMGPKAEADVLQILDEVAQGYRIRYTIVCGGSMGATSALALAALHPDRVDGVVALNGTANLVEYEGFQEAIAASYGGTKAEAPEVYAQRSAELHADRLTMPLAATVGGRDTVVPPGSVRRLCARLRNAGRSVLLIDRAEGGHATDYADATAAVDYVLEQVRR